MSSSKPVPAIDENLDRIRAFAQGQSKRSLAARAKINDTVLRNLDKPGWNPTADTVRLLEAVIPKDFGSGEPKGDR